MSQDKKNKELDSTLLCAGHGRTLCACYECIKEFKAEFYPLLERVKREMGVLYSMSVHPTEQRNEYVATIKAIDNALGGNDGS